MATELLFEDKEDFKQKYNAMFGRVYGKTFDKSSIAERYTVLVKLVGREAKEIREQSTGEAVKNNKKKVYYFSMEFLIGKLLENYLINFGVLDIVREGLSDMGEDLDVLLEQEKDAGLGNGGLGRLAACFIDSLASLGYNGQGNGIRYRYGLFKQEIKDGRQVELPDNWLEGGYPWETARPAAAELVHFGGEVVRHYEGDKFWCT